MADSCIFMKHNVSQWQLGVFSGFIYQCRRKDSCLTSVYTILAMLELNMALAFQLTAHSSRTEAGKTQLA